MAHLTLVLQGREVRKFVLNPSVTTIGRAQDNDIVINNLALSRRHAQVERKGARYEVTDLGSQNGVFVNNERIRSARVLTTSDTITLGTYQFVFTEESDAEPRGRDLVRRPEKPAGLASGYEPVRVATAAAPFAPEDHVPLLVLTYNEVELQRFPLKRDSCLIGRAKECDVQIAERRLSRKHCEIVRMDGIYFVKDLGSQNGTYVNRKRIQDIHELEDGDVLNFAEYAVRYIADDALYDGPDQVHSYRGGVAGRPEPSDDGLLSDAFEAGSEASGRVQAKKARFDDVATEDHRRPRGTRKDVVVSKTGYAHIPPTPKRPSGKGARELPEARANELLQDVPDDVGDVRPDSRLEDWYKAREEEPSDNDDPSALLRGQSSVSQILNSMMVEQKELDKNLSLKARQRKFFIDVRHGQERIYQGPLTLPVTILGTDRDADIQLRGRYVAGRHSILVRVKDSLLLVRLGSSSAARVNGLPKLQAFLKTGDVIQIDETTIRITEE